MVSVQQCGVKLRSAWEGALLLLVLSCSEREWVTGATPRGPEPVWLQPTRAHTSRDPSRGSRLTGRPIATAVD